MKIYKCRDGNNRLFLKIQYTLTKQQLIDMIAWKTNEDGKLITNFIKGTTSRWTKKELMKEIKQGLFISGIELLSSDVTGDVTEKQIEHATKLIEKFFPELDGEK